MPFTLRRYCSGCIKLVLLDTNITEIDKDKNFIGFEIFKIFDLRNISLQHIRPGAFINAPHLEEIFLSSNNLTMIDPDVFNNLTNLTVLDLSVNSITRIQPKFSNENNLSQLDISQNLLQSLENQLLNLKSLVVLNVSNNNISNLSFESIPLNVQTFLASNNNLTTLTCCNNNASCFNPNLLDLSHNNLKELDRNIFNQLNSLQTLLLQYNKLEFLPPDIFRKLSHIQYLNLSFNKIKIIPSRLFNTQRMLNVLDLSNNQISKFDGSNFINMYNLRVIYIHNNSLKDLDLTQIRNKNLKYIYLDNNKFICDDLFIIVQHLIELKVTVVVGNRSNNLNIFGNICYKGNNVQVTHYFNSNIKEVVFVTLAVCIVTIASFLFLKFKVCNRNRESDELQLINMYVVFLIFLVNSCIVTILKLSRSKIWIEGMF